jgi:hypothetical protein
MIDGKLKHDFTNNSLRLEILIRMITDDLATNKLPDRQLIIDLEEFLAMAQEHTKAIASFYNHD